MASPTFINLITQPLSGTLKIFTNLANFSQSRGNKYGMQFFLALVYKMKVK